MKDWEPPLPVDKWYAHIWRSLLKRNSRKRAGMSKTTVRPRGQEEATLLEEDEMKDGLGNPIRPGGTMANATDEQLGALTEEDDDTFHWRYAILEKKHGGETYYHVCEEYPGMGYTDPETPMGDTPEELQIELEMMLADVKGAIAHKNIIVDGAPYDNWRVAELEKEETVPWDDDIGDDPTVRIKVEDE
jgi:hypothetical protein